MASVLPVTPDIEPQGYDRERLDPERAKDELCDAIVHSALAGRHDIDILSGLCELLNTMGVAVVRASIAMDLLDPVYDGRGVRWLRGKGGLEEVFKRDDETPTDDWNKSPFYFLLHSGHTSLRRRLDSTYQRGEFPLVDRFQDEGVTEYIAFSAKVGPSLRLGEGEGLVASFTTDAPGGFTDAEFGLFTSIMPTLTLAIMLRTINRAARTLITTYLGSSAAERVLAGNIVRGRADPIRAVVWFSDLVGFTRISDNISADSVLALLNDYAEAQVEEIEAHSGHVLKFIGDGLLAIFPDDDVSQACGNALNAAIKMRERIAALNVRRAAAGLPVTDTHLALHVGELLYGNLGSPRRLDFSVLGPAVNEAARIEALCGSLEQPVIVSWAFADAAGEARQQLVSLGRYAMKGIARPQELFTLDPG